MKTLFTLLILISICIGGCAENSSVLRTQGSKSFFDGAVYEGESKILDEDTTGS